MAVSVVAFLGFVGLWLAAVGPTGFTILHLSSLAALSLLLAALCHWTAMPPPASRAAREALQYAIDRGMEGMALLDAEGRYIYLNEAHAKIYGYNVSELVGRSWKMLYDPDQTIWIEATAFTTMHAEQRWSGELVGRTKMGAVVHVEVGLQLLPQQGSVSEGFLYTSRNITARKKTEESLLRTRFAMDQAVDAVYWIDPQARILYTNAAASAMLGYTAEEFLRMTVHDLNPDFLPSVWSEWWEETREKKVISLETIHLTKDGRPIPIDIRVAFLAYGGQEFHCAYVRDISERKRSDQALRESQERFELAARATNDGIWDWNILTGAQYWSDRHYKLVGLELDALTPTYDARISLVHPDDADRVHQATRHHLETREPYDIEVRVRMKDGRYRWFHDRGHAVWDASGRPVRMVGSISDVTERRIAEEKLRTAHAELEQRVADRTVQLALANQSLQSDIAERKRTEEALRESELRYKLLTEATFDGIAIHDQGILLEVNAGLERIFGYEPGELIGRPMWNLIAEESRDLVLANMKNGVLGPYEAIGRRKDGSTFPGEVVVRPYHFRGKEVRLVAGRDITERKYLDAERLRYTAELEHQVAQRTAEIAKLEAQRAQTEKLAAMGRLAAGVAHEINNPIAGIKNAFTLVKQAVDPTHPHYEFAGMIDREIARVSSIVQNMYQLYRPESGRAEPVDLQTMTNDIQALFAKRLQQRRLKLVIEADPCLKRLCVPRGDLLQVLLNLVNNAIDCSREASRVTLILREEPEMVRIAVSDEGSGIPPDILPHIFDPFYTTKMGNDQKSMGLGLSVSRSLVMAMGGTIEVETRSNQGSTFSILIPRNRTEMSVQESGELQREVVIHEN